MLQCGEIMYLITVFHLKRRFHIWGTPAKVIRQKKTKLRPPLIGYAYVRQKKKEAVFTITPDSVHICWYDRMESSADKKCSTLILNKSGRGDEAIYTIDNSHLKLFDTISYIT